MFIEVINYGTNVEYFKVAGRVFHILEEAQVFLNTINVLFEASQESVRIVGDEGGVCYQNKEGSLHRTDGPAIENPDGYKEWWINGKLHREDGPATEYEEGTKKWYKHGKLHREDGPAIEWSTGAKEWWIEGEHYFEDKFLEIMGLPPKSDLEKFMEKISPDDRELLEKSGLPVESPVQEEKKAEKELRSIV